jgi:tetraacyldisaccharide-1-P 4'-kinase
LRHQGVSVGVISRGYRGRVGKKAHIVSASGQCHRCWRRAPVNTESVGLPGGGLS